MSTTHFPFNFSERGIHGGERQIIGIAANGLDLIGEDDETEEKKSEIHLGIFEFRFTRFSLIESDFSRGIED